MVKKSSTCKCGGGYSRNKSSWVALLHREGKTSQLKCLKCSWKWWSSCRYALKLSLHKERSRKGCTNEMILQRLLEGTLYIDPHTAQVFSTLKSQQPQELTQSGDKHDSGYQFVSVCCLGKKKKIAVHVLQWIQANRRTVPPAHDIHHKRSPPRPQLKDNSLSNLELRLSHENQGDKSLPEPF